MMCVSGGVAQAVNHSTQENFNYIFKLCISAISKTEDYANLIINSDYDVAMIRRQDCRSLGESIGLLSHTSAKGAESMLCALDTRIILQERYLALDYFISAVDAGMKGKMTLFEEYKRRMGESITNAEQAQQEFKTKYGY